MEERTCSLIKFASLCMSDIPVKVTRMKVTYFAVTFICCIFKVHSLPLIQDIIAPVPINYGFHAGFQFPRMPKFGFEEHEIPVPIPDLVNVDFPVFIPTFKIMPDQ